jgi:beta-glucosidase-like glycosyl hydrolase
MMTGMARGLKLAELSEEERNQCCVPQAAARAIEAGADMVLFNTPDPKVTVNAMIASITSAVTSHRMSMTRLDDAVQHVFRVKNASLCR